MSEGLAAEQFDKVAGTLDDAQLVFAYLPEYQDNLLSEDLKKRFEPLLAKQDADLVSRFTEHRGNFQVAFAKLSLDAQQLQKLRTFVEDDVSRADHEAGNIKKVAATELRGNTMRAVVLIALVFAVFCVGYYYIAPTQKPTFEALENLVYETVVMNEDDGRLDLPTKNIAEVQAFIERSPNLGFEPMRPAALPGWKVEGATVIDYEFAKIPVIQFIHPDQKDRFFLFQYQGKISDLPRAETGKYADLVYQAYSDDRVNIIAWQAKENVMAMAIGTRGAAEMAQMARTVLSK